MSGEFIYNQEDYYREQYWHMPGTKKGILEYLGSHGTEWSQISDSYPEFLGLANRPKSKRIDKLSPVTIISPDSFEHHLNQFKGQVELHASEWQKESLERPGYPSRIVMFWDVDLYDKPTPNWSRDNPRDAFNVLEPTYQLMQSVLNEYGIPYLAIVSGRGYNFVTQIPATSPVMDEMLNISGPIEPTVLGKQAHPYINLKRRKPVPPKTESGHVAAARLQQFLFGQIIRQARSHSVVPIEVSDIGINGIALDNTTMVYSVDKRLTTVIGTPYFIKSEISGAGPPPTVLKIPRHSKNYNLKLEEIFIYRGRYDLASDIMSQFDCSIPDGSGGIAQLLEAYNASDLKILHEAMDSTFGDPPERFTTGYRRYRDISDRTAHPDKIYNLILGANQMLLEPNNLNDFVWEIFEAWSNKEDPLSVAPHIAGLLRAIYEDPRFRWGSRWTKQTDALRYARGWVTIMLGQAFEKKGQSEI
ncbi:MAG: hypothetical protein ABSB12_02310 [Candidatus Saccharimonadales bacterium]